MDVYTTSFCLALPDDRRVAANADGNGVVRPKTSQSFSSTASGEGKRKSNASSSTTEDGEEATGEKNYDEALQKLCVDTMAQFQCMVTVNKIDPATAPTAPLIPPAVATLVAQANTENGAPSPTSATAPSFVFAPPTNVQAGWNIHLSGGYQAVMGARGAILRDNPLKRTSVIRVPRSEVMDAKGVVRGDMRRKLDDIAKLTTTTLLIKEPQAANSNTGVVHAGGSSAAIAKGLGLETERNIDISISGATDDVEQARVRLLVLLDELSGLHSEVCEIDYKLHNIIAGRKRQVIQTIQEDTGTSIYFPSPLPALIGPRTAQSLAKQNLIFITGEFFGVQRARDMLFQVSVHKSKCIISRDTAVLPRKLDWMLSDRLEEIKTIMYDNATFVNFPVIGSQASLISVYGDHRVNIERTIRSVMLLTCHFYVASVWLLPVSFDAFMPPPTINPSQVPDMLKKISIASGAEVVFKSNCFELHGLEQQVRGGVQMVLDLEISKSFHHEIRFQVELANEHRDFISGKKNGKLNKIMKTAGVKIKFETFNDYNFLIDVAGGDKSALAGLGQLQEELPAEISFHVPESYHKRIIGVGGKSIQRIMKRFGVYVKFSNAEEFAALGGYTENEDNVIARTPGKNGASLEHLKAAILELVQPRDKDFVTETVSIPFRYHRTLWGEKSIFIHDIENKTNSQVRFPNKESASDIVSIFGPESQVHLAAQMLLDHVPFEAELRLPHSKEFAALSLTPEWIQLVERTKHELNVTIQPWVDRSGADEESLIKFLLNRSNVHFATSARDQIEEFLREHSVR